MSNPVQNMLRDACEGYTLEGLRRLVRWYLDANQVTPDGIDVPDPNFPDEWLDHCLNDSFFMLSVELALTFEGQFYETMDVPISSATPTVQLPGNMFKIDRVMYKVGESYWPLPYSMNHFAPDYASGSASWAIPPSYWIRDATTLVLNPPPAVDGSLRIRWYRQPNCMRDENDVPDNNLLYIWHYLLAKAAAVKAMTKTNDDSSDLQTQVNEAMLMFRKSIDRRSAGPKFITPWFGGHPNAGSGGSYG